MPGKTPQKNGKSAENGLRGNQDVDMKDSSAKAKGTKDGDEEMTVVVPPSKASKQSADADGDVSMGGEDQAEDGEAKVDPVVQAVAGRSLTRGRA
jgi:26S proteasome regulatory subunit N3